MRGQVPAHLLVVVERHPTVSNRASRHLADIMHESGQAQKEVFAGRVVDDPEGVLEHVEGVKVRVLTHPPAGVELGHEVAKEPGFREQTKAHRGAGRGQELHQLVPLALGGDRGQPSGLGRHRRRRGRVDPELEDGGESSRPKEAKGILPKAGAGIADRPNPPPIQILHPAERIHEASPRRVVRQRVHGEVPAGEIVLDRVREPHVVGVPVVGVRTVFAVRRDLELGVPLAHLDRAVGGVKKGGAGEAGANLLGRGIGGDVPIRDRQPLKNEVAHRPPHHVGFEAGGDKGVDHDPEFGRGRRGVCDGKFARQRAEVEHGHRSGIGATKCGDIVPNGG